MRTIMKRLITAKVMPVHTLALLLVLSTVLVADAAIGDQETAPPLRCTITYDFVGHLGQFDDEERLLVWDGKIHGDIEGVILWWVDLTRKQVIGQASHYAARWEIWDLADNLLLAGDSAGTTRVPLPLGEDGIWRGKGKVTEASTGFEDWLGRQEHSEGHFTWAAPGLPDHGDGTFRIN